MKDLVRLMIEMAEKEMEKLSKNIDKMKAIGEENAKVFNKEFPKLIIKYR